MSASKWTLFMFLLTYVLKSAVSEEVKATPEDDVILRCQNPRDKDFMLLKWIRPDLMSDGYVYFFRENRSYVRNQHPSFVGRVQLRDPQMKDGDFSVILKYVGINDTGTYECFVGKNNTGLSSELINVIHLKVEAVQTNITAEPGDTVTLPCQVPRNTQILVVEWIRPDLKPEYVFWYQNGKSDPDHQHPSFRNRVELKDSEMKDGDLSLILKNVIKNDTGTYECHVYQSQRNHTMSIIDLSVEDSGHTAGNTRDGLVAGLSVLALLLAAGVFAILKKKRRQPYQPPGASTEL